MKKCVQLVVLAMMVGLAAVAVTAKDAPQPSGDVILTVSGTIALTNGDGIFAMDEAMLTALPQVEYFVVDPWMGDNTYGGVLLSTLLEYVGFPDGATQVVLVCSDEAEFAISIADIVAYPIMLAMEADGDAIGGSIGGPIKVAYPYNSYPSLEEVYPPENWAWFVVEVRVEY